MVSEKAPKAFTEESIAFSLFWGKRLDAKVSGGRYWFSNMTGETATKEV